MITDIIKHFWRVMSFLQELNRVSYFTMNNTTEPLNGSQLAKMKKYIPYMSQP